MTENLVILLSGVGFMALALTGGLAYLIAENTVSKVKRAELALLEHELQQIVDAVSLQPIKPTEIK